MIIIQCPGGQNTAWTSGGHRSYDAGMALKVTGTTRLVDHREGYLSIECLHCRHEREMSAEALARIIGWETRLARELHRLRCSMCGRHGPQVAIFYRQRPRGWTSHPT